MIPNFLMLSIWKNFKRNVTQKKRDALFAPFV